MAVLVIFEPGKSPATLTLSEPLAVGRDSQSDLPLIHQGISRQHVRFEPDPDADGWIVRDLGSANGTFVNRVRVQRARLAAGDTLDIGPVRLVFQTHESAGIVLAKPALGDATLELGPPNKRLSLLYEVTRAAGAIDNVEILLDRILDGVLKLVGGERAMVVLIDGTHREVLRRVASPGRLHDSGDVIVPRTMTQAMINRHEAVIIRDGNRANTEEAPSKLGILSAMGAPLEMAGQVLGFLYVDDRNAHKRFNGEDLDFLTALARLAAVTLDNAERLSRATGVAEAASRIGPVQEIVGQCPAVQKMRNLITKCAASPTTSVLITGECGVGKELVARTLHAASARAHRAFVAVNCAAMPETMLEGALFGHEKGAFTGATQRRRGQFILADQGTLFLDEIGDLSLSAQAKVIRALQDGEVMPLGAEYPLHVDVRIIAATRKDLRREVAEGRFREDLFYRLGALEIAVPPLRDRDTDIESLARIFLESAALNLDKKFQGFSQAALTAMLVYPWPGNVRELRNEVERAVVLAEGPFIELDDLSPSLVRHYVSPSGESGPSTSLAARFAALEPTERALVEEAMETARGNLAEAARLLGVTRIMMRRRVEKFGLKYGDD